MQKIINFATFFALFTQTNGQQHATCTELMPLHQALECVQAVQIPTWMARQTPRAMAEVLEQFYAFVHLAKDPLAAPQVNDMGYAPFSEKVDILTELHAISEKFERINSENVSVVDVIFPMNQLFNQLRDAHMNQYGARDDTVQGSKTSFTVFNGILDGFKLRAFLGDNQSPLIITARAPNTQREAVLAEGDLIVLLDGIPAKTIAGMKPMEWIIQTVARNPVFKLPYKGLGSRVNQVLGQPFDFEFVRVGDIRTLDGEYEVEFLNGKFGIIWWGVKTPGTYTRFAPDTCSALFKSWYDAILVVDPSRPELCDHKFRATAPPAPPSAPAASNPVDQAIFDGWNYNRDLSMATQCFEEKGYCVLSWITVGALAPSLAAWFQLVEMARVRNITNLVLEVNNNGGGNVETAYAMFHQFMPATNSQNACNDGDELMGPVAQKMVQEGWYFNSTNPEGLRSIATDLSTMGPYAERLMANQCAEGNQVFSQMAKLIAAIKVFSMDTNRQILESNQADETIVTVMSTNFTEKAFEIIQQLTRACHEGSLTAEALSATAQKIAVGAFNPFTSIAYDGTHDPFLTPAPRDLGIDWATYTAKYHVSLCSAMDRKAPDHPFKEILVMSSGYCGSSCDTVTRSSYLWSKSGKKGPKFNYVAWGGTGEHPTVQNLTGTSYPGGAQGNGDRLSPTWVWYAQASIFKLLTNTEKLGDLQELLEMLPEFPASNDNLTPLFPKLEMFQNAYGKKALPSEYYIVPADLYLRKWYNHLGGNWGTSYPGVLEAYDDVAALFGTY